MSSVRAGVREPNVEPEPRAFRRTTCSIRSLPTLSCLPSWIRRTVAQDRRFRAQTPRSVRPWTVKRVLSTLYPRLDRPVFIVGAPRSGPTFLGQCIAALPEISYHFEPVATKAATRYVFEGRWGFARSRLVFRSVYRLLLQLYGEGDLRFSEKTPQNCFVIEFLARAFPDATFVHIVRDGRDAALSYSKKPWLLARSAGRGSREAGGYLNGPHARFWVEPDRRAEFESTTDFHPCIWAWRLHMESALRQTAELFRLHGITSCDTRTWCGSRGCALRDHDEHPSGLQDRSRARPDLGIRRPVGRSGIRTHPAARRVVHLRRCRSRPCRGTWAREGAAALQLARPARRGRYTVMVVSRRIASLLVAVLMIAGPVSAEICDVTCAAHAHTDAQAPVMPPHQLHDSAIRHASAHPHHQGPATQVGSSRAELSAPPRSCGHHAATIVSTLNKLAPMTHASVGVRTFIAAGDVSLRSPVPALSEAHSPPGPIRSVTRLRI